MLDVILCSIAVNRYFSLAKFLSAGGSRPGSRLRWIIVDEDCGLQLGTAVVRFGESQAQRCRSETGNIQRGDVGRTAKVGRDAFVRHRNPRDRLLRQSVQLLRPRRKQRTVRVRRFRVAIEQQIDLTAANADREPTRNDEPSFDTV